MFAAPELIEIGHGMLPDRMMRCEEIAKANTSHGSNPAAISLGRQAIVTASSR